MMAEEPTEQEESEELDEQEMLEALWDEFPFLQEDLVAGISTAIGRNELEHFTRGKYALVLILWDAPAKLHLELQTDCGRRDAHGHVVKRSKDDVRALCEKWLGSTIEWEIGCFNVVIVTADDMLHVPLEERDVLTYYREAKN